MKKFIAALVAFFAPVLAFAQGTPGTFQYAIGQFQGILNVVIPIMVTLAVIYFIWGVVQYVTSGDAEKKEQGQQHMIWGLIGIFVIVSIWGLVALLANTFGISNNQTIGGGTGTGIIPCVGGVYDPSTGQCQ